MEDKSMCLMGREVDTAKTLSLDRLVLGIIAQLTMDPRNLDVWVNKGLIGIGELLGLERAFIRIIDEHFIIKNQTFLWNRMETDSRPIPQYTMETLKGEFHQFRDESSFGIILPMSLQNLTIGYMGFISERRKSIMDQENIMVLRRFCKIITHVLVQNNKHKLLSRTEEKFRRLFNQVADMVFVNQIMENGLPGHVIEANDAACNKLGYTREELRLLSLYQLGMPADMGKMEHIFQALLNGEIECYEMFFFSKAGVRIPVEINTLFFELDYQKVVLTVARDITERKNIERKLIENNEQLKKTLCKLEQAQKQIIKQEKLAGIGQLAAGIAHEINNPLGFISSNIETSRKYSQAVKETMIAYKNFVERVRHILPENMNAEIQQLYDLEKKNDIAFILNDHEELYDDIEDGLKRINEIVLGVKAFSRQEQNEIFEEYDLNKSIRNLLLITKNNIKYHARLMETLGDIPKIQAIGSKIEQVLLNIILNASDAIKEKNSKGLGLIKITTDEDDGFVRCRIEDNGVGINKEYIDKIFDPFFTTKPPGHGTGIGLSIAHEIIVNLHHGKILADSTPFVGSRFTILLPVHQNETKQVTDDE